MPRSYLVSSLPDHELAELQRLMAEEIREVAVFFMNPDGIITAWNRAAEEMKGYTAEDVIGQHLRLLYTESDKARHWAEHNLDEAAKHGFYREEQWRQRKDGTLFWASISLTALRNEAGTLVGYSKITLDLTSHLELEQCLDEKAEVDRILHAARAGTWKWNLATDLVEVSPRFLTQLGYPQGENIFAFDRWLALIHPNEEREVSRKIHDARARATYLPFALQMRMRRNDGGYRWFYMQVDWYHEEGKEPVMMGVNVDVHNLKAAQEEREQLLQQLQTEKEKAQITLASITDGVITTGLEGEVLTLNPAAERLTGWTESRARNMAVSEVFRARDEATQLPAPNPVEACLAEGRIVHGWRNTMLINRQGLQYSIESSSAPIRLSDGEMVGAVLVLHDVTESRRLLHELRYQATHDGLTGLVNRAEFEARLKGAVERARPLSRPDSILLYMDLDQFKIVNDTCGHTDGDELLRQLAQLYQGQVRDGDTLARIGGDEFALIAEHCTTEDAVAVAEKMLDATRNYRFTCRGHVFQVGVSIGLVPISGSTSTVEQLLREADHACYLAKESGRSRVYIQQTNDIDIAQRRSDMQWVRRLDEARQTDSLELFYQPIMPIGLHGGGLCYEILLRLKDNGDALVGPATFMPAAERYDMMPALDRWVLWKSLQWLEQNPQHISDLDLCTINLSRRTLADESFQQYVHELFDSTSIPASKICFEITETGAIANMAKTIAFIEALAERGCKFALDDFGTGMTSFTYLKQLPVDFIKIDGSFIQSMCTSAVDHEMVRFANDISHMMGRRSIAEHVTSESILQKLREIGVDYAQGYWLGKPHPLGE